MKLSTIKLTLFLFTAVLMPQLFYACSPKAETKESTTFKKIGSEQEFSKIIDNKETKLIVFDLYADWCGPCRILHPTLESLSKKYADKAEFYRINVDALPGIAAAFGTNGIPYVVFVKDKKAIGSLVGLNPSESYEKVINACTSADAGLCDQVLKTL